jgi:hypothetical protein
VSAAAAAVGQATASASAAAEAVRTHSLPAAPHGYPRGRSERWATGRGGARDAKLRRCCAAARQRRSFASCDAAALCGARLRARRNASARLSSRVGA